MREAIRWRPRVELTRAETSICKRLTRTGRLYRFLRLHRHELFDEAFQARLAETYAPDYGPGRPPVPPALLMMVTLLQAYSGVSDAEAVHLALFDKRWQMVLDCIGCEGPDGDGRAPFSQGLLAQFRFRMIQNELDRELIRRTVELARQTKDFGDKALRVALDSAPIWGAGRVEDTYNLIGHALMVCVARAADAEELASNEVIAAAGLEVVGGLSVKGTLDVDWEDANAKQEALNQLLTDVERFGTWWAARTPKPGKQAEVEAVQAAIAQLERLVQQDTEPDPDGTGRRLIDGTAHDRQISVSDPQMRHGRKSKSTRVDGYKGHAAVELDEQLILEAVATPANVAESEGGDQMRSNVEHYGPVGEMHIDRGYLAGSWVEELHRAGVPIYCKPRNQPNRGLFPKQAFRIDLAAQEVHCPGGDVAPIPKRARSSGIRLVQFRHCATCAIRTACTPNQKGRTIVIHPQEDLLQKLLDRKQTPQGRQQLRERVTIEHRLAHILVYQPHQARYIGARKNTLAFRRAAAIVNLQVIDGAPVS